MGTNLTIYNRNGEKKGNLFSRLKATAVSKATQKTQLLADDTVTLSVISATPLDITIGDYIILFGKRYTVNQLPQPTKEGERRYSYDITLEGLQYQLIDIHYHLPEDAYGETYYANLRRHLEILEWNINRIHPGWTVQVDQDAYSEDDYQNITTTEKNALAMLQDLCELFKVEFEITPQGEGGLVHVKKKAGVTHPFTLRYGRGKGLYKLSRANVNNAGVINRLYVYGSQENLGRNYCHTKLCLAESSRLTSYLEDPESITAYGVKEGEKNYPDIKPERVGIITALGADRLTFIDASGDEDDPANPPMFDLNEKDENGTKWLIDGTAAKIKMQTGNLAGYEFDLHSYDHTTKTFVVNRFKDENGLEIPNDTQDAFSFGVGDKYIITDIQLPDSYIKKAQAELEEAARVDFAPLTQPQVSYKLSLTESFFVALWGKSVAAEVLHVGDYIHIEDKDIGVDKEVRIIAINRDLLRPHTYDITLSDTVTKSTAVRVINDIKEIQDAINQNTGFGDPGKARRRWMATQELLNLVFDPEGDYYSDKIKPLSIETQMLSVGAKSTQFTLQNVTIQPNYNGDPNAINFSAGLLVHYAIDPDTTRPWPLTGNTFSGLNPLTPYYIYAVCPRQGGSATYLLDTAAHQCEERADVYYFLIGVLNSMSTDQHGGNPARLISLTYGSSTINGRFVRCGRIESSGGGATYFDLDTGVISGRILFRSSDGSIRDVADLAGQTEALDNYINNVLRDELDGLQGQLDGVIEQHFFDVDPSPNDTEPRADANAPAQEWEQTDEAADNDNEKEKHLGDLYYNTTTGKVWRYIKAKIRPRPGAALSANYYYFWRELEDTELAQALQLAKDAMAAADDKARIFYVTPYAPYDPGDLWVQGSGGDIKVCTKGRAEGATPSFLESEWEKASKYTDDSGLENFIRGQYAGDVDNLLNQIDGKIECYYTASDPSNSWPAEDIPRHNGDQWYNTTTKKLYRYVVLGWLLSTNGYVYQYIRDADAINIIYDNVNHRTTYWKRIEDADALAAAQAAANAQDTADGKRTVFVTTPVAPYQVGDLWLKGIDSTGKAAGGLWRCIKANNVKGSFNDTDWVEATYYDCTQTTIDGGIVTAGTVQLANEFTGSIVAGITGGFGKTYKETAGTPESEKVRIWAGASEGGRLGAPFRVLQNGKMFATDAEISGKITSSEGEIAGWLLSKGLLSSADGIIQLDGQAGQIRAAGCVVMDAEGFSLVHDGYRRVKVANISVGDYNGDLLNEVLDRTGSPSQHTQRCSLYVPYGGSYYYSNPFKTEVFSLGSFEANSQITINRAVFTFCVPESNKSQTNRKPVELSLGAPGIRLELLRNGVVIKTWQGSYGNSYKTGDWVTATATANETIVVKAGEEGEYSLRVTSPAQWGWKTEHSAIFEDYTITTSVYYKFTRGNYQHTLLGYDGLISTWKNGYMFLNGDAFIVKFGNYALKIATDGIKKSTNGGASFSNM